MHSWAVAFIAQAQPSKDKSYMHVILAIVRVAVDGLESGPEREFKLVQAL